jgi:uncharacterized damage-inducible protein DinB
LSLSFEFSIPFARLYDHLYWADRNVLESLRSAAHPPVRAIELYAHILGAENVWLSRIHSQPTTLAVWPALTLEQCEKISAANNESFARVVESLNPTALAKQISYRNSAGASFTSTLEEILLHVALHGSYHRGQIAMLLRDSGETPVPTDFIAFARGAPAATHTTTR